MGSVSSIRFICIYLLFSNVYCFSTQRITPSSIASPTTCRAPSRSGSSLEMSLTADHPKSSPASDDMKNEKESAKLSAFRQQLERTLRRSSENDSKQKQKRRQTQTQSESPVMKVESLQEYKTIVAEERNKITVVRFYATWCKACRAIKPKFYQLARMHPEISFVEVPVTEQNADLHQGLGIPTLPFGHIYHPDAGLVEEMKIGKANFGTFAKTMSWYADGFCELNGVGDCSNPLTEKKSDVTKIGLV
uniref:Thioredoxin domain-containing protein n=1 Tax=Proboscia inermis TaxID=420281 RepID=A0A7S0CI31_9STRA|mmetsp:Transcript_49660/g.50027  ORF Transcript_49660/g.50027 Transcript_49660/m.50027 type:complete len:248 (+) Transcript_49660:132-875(+)